MSKCKYGMLAECDSDSCQGCPSYEGYKLAQRNAKVVREAKSIMARPLRNAPLEKRVI